MDTNTAKNAKYCLPARVLHWLSAGVILWALTSGFMMAVIEVSEELKASISEFNIAVTVLFIPFFLLRIYFAITRKKPETIELSRLNNQIAACAHFLIYLTVCFVLTTGVLMMERNINLFNIMEISYLIDNPAITDIMSDLHKYGSIILSLLVLLHIAAVIKHEMSGVRILKKML